MNNINFKDNIKRYTVYLVITAIVVLAVINIKEVITYAGTLVSIFSPLILGCVIAYVLNIIMVRMEAKYFPKSDKKLVKVSRRPVCLIGALLLVFVIIGLLLMLILPEVANIFVVLGESIPKLFTQIQEFLALYAKEYPLYADYIEDAIVNTKIDWQATLSSLAGFATNGVTGFISSTVNVISTVAGGVVNAVIGIIFAVYILLSKEKLHIQVNKLLNCYLKPKNANRVRYFFSTADKTFSSFIIGQCTEAIILGLLCALGMTILQLPYATTIGTLIGATALVPIVGAYLGAGLGALMILVVDPIKALWFIIFLVILQQLEGNIIYPKVVGSSIGLPGMWVLAAVTVGGSFGGIVGMMMGVPVVATAYKLIQNDVHKRETANAAATDETQSEDIEMSPPSADSAETKETDNNDSNTNQNGVV